MKKFIKSLSCFSLGLTVLTIGTITTAQANDFDYTVKPPYMPYGYSQDHFKAGAYWYCNSQHEYCFEYGEMHLENYQRINGNKLLTVLRNIFVRDQNYNCTMPISNYTFSCTKQLPDHFGWAAKVKYDSYYGILQLVKVHYNPESGLGNSYGASSVADSVLSY